MATDIEWPYGSDIGLTASGDWNLLVDTTAAAPASEQKVLRLGMTGAEVKDDTGVVVTQADDKFAKDWGVGLPRYLGKNIVAQGKINIVNAYNQAFEEDSNFVTTPTPSIAIESVQAGEELDVTVKVRTALGAQANVTANPNSILNKSGG